MAGGAEILVTGAEGYIGSRLVRVLAAKGLAVRSLVRAPAPFVDGDQVVVELTEDTERLVAACSGVSTVIHLAGLNEVAAREDPGAALTATALASLRVGEACLAAGVRRLIYMSTVHVYGRRIGEGAMLSEDLRVEPTAPYAIARLTSEHVLAGIGDGEFELVVFRLTNSVGAPVDPSVNRWTLVVNDLSRQGVARSVLELRTSGVQWRDFIPLADVCDIVAAASRSGPDAVLPPGTYNLGSGSPVTIRTVAERIQDAIERATGTRPALHAPPPPEARPEPYHVSVERLAHHGLAPSSRLEDAIAETVDFCLDHRDRLE